MLINEFDKEKITKSSNIYLTVYYIFKKPLLFIPPILFQIVSLQDIKSDESSDFLYSPSVGRPFTHSLIQ